MSTTIALGAPDRPPPVSRPRRPVRRQPRAGRDRRGPARPRSSVRITPLAPGTWPPVPDGCAPNGNAYRVEMTYEPGRAGRRGSRNRGRCWSRSPSSAGSCSSRRDATTRGAGRARVISPSQLTMTAPFAAPGYYLAATNLPELAAPPATRRTSRSWSVSHRGGRGVNVPRRVSVRAPAPRPSGLNATIGG